MKKIIFILFTSLFSSVAFAANISAPTFYGVSITSGLYQGYNYNNVKNNSLSGLNLDLTANFGSVEFGFGGELLRKIAIVDTNQDTSLQDFNGNSGLQNAVIMAPYFIVRGNIGIDDNSAIVPALKIGMTNFNDKKYSRVIDNNTFEEISYTGGLYLGAAVGYRISDVIISLDYKYINIKREYESEYYIGFNDIETESTSSKGNHSIGISIQYKVNILNR